MNDKTKTILVNLCKQMNREKHSLEKQVNSLTKLSQNSEGFEKSWAESLSKIFEKEYLELEETIICVSSDIQNN